MRDRPKTVGNPAAKYCCGGLRCGVLAYAGGGTGARGGRVDLSKVVLLCRILRPPLFAPLFAPPAPLETPPDFGARVPVLFLVVPKFSDQDDVRFKPLDAVFAFIVLVLVNRPEPLRDIEGDDFGLDEGVFFVVVVAVFEPFLFSRLLPVLFFFAPRFLGAAIDAAAPPVAALTASLPESKASLPSLSKGALPPAALPDSLTERWCRSTTSSALCFPPPMSSSGVHRFINALPAPVAGSGCNISDPRGDRRVSLLFLLPSWLPFTLLSPPLKLPLPPPPPPSIAKGLVLLPPDVDAVAASAAAANAFINAAV